MLQELSVSARKSVTARRIVKVQHALRFEDLLSDWTNGLDASFTETGCHSGGLADG